MKDVDIDQLIFQTAEELQETKHGPFTFREWRTKLASVALEKGIGVLNTPKMEGIVNVLFERYCDSITPGLFLPKPMTPFSGQLFDIPAIERLFTYTPVVINELTTNSTTFSYDAFLLKLAEYVENGTRMLIEQIQSLDIKKMINPYAKPVRGGRYFEKRELPALPRGLKSVFALDPYEFEGFVGNLLKAMGFDSVSIIGRSGDRGVDLVATDPGQKLTIIQCKRYFQHKVSSTPIQRLHSFAVTRGATRKILITTSGFTKQAEQEAKITGTELISGGILEGLISKYLPEYFT